MTFHSMVTIGLNNNRLASCWKRWGREARAFAFQYSRTRRVCAGFHFVQVTLIPC
jgi:hypothetical protein